jgi:hypothetical protein
MKPTDTLLGEAYVRLALAIDQHLPGYIDAYFGPPEWKAQAEADGKRPLAELRRAAEDLSGAIANQDRSDPQQQDFLEKQVRAMVTSLRLLAGERLPLAEEVAALYDITPAWVEESVFEDAHRELDDLLPAGETLRERMIARKQALEVPVEQVAEVLPIICADLRQRARQRFPLPADETFELQFVSGQPWSAYHWYLGDGRSRIEINTDLPLRVNRLGELMAHEGYPGHHTELSIKDRRFYRAAGLVEHSLTLINTPSCAVSEGIAVQALDVLMTPAEQAAWQAEVVYPRAGMGHLDAGREQRIDTVARKLTGVVDNAAFLLHDGGLPPGEVSTYLQRYALLREEEAQKNVDFILNPLYRSYIFTYDSGRQLLESLFARDEDHNHWFKRLLTEPVTPTQIRGWIAA